MILYIEPKRAVTLEEDASEEEHDNKTKVDEREKRKVEKSMQTKPDAQKKLNGSSQQTSRLATVENEQRLPERPWVQGYLCAVITNMASCVSLHTQGLLHRLLGYVLGGNMHNPADYSFLSSVVGLIKAENRDLAAVQKVLGSEEGRKRRVRGK